MGEREGDVSPIFQTRPGKQLDLRLMGGFCQNRESVIEGELLCKSQ